MDYDTMRDLVDAARARMVDAQGNNQEMLALFNGITIWLMALVEAAWENPASKAIRNPAGPRS
jgi:hypothetical protein